MLLKGKTAIVTGCNRGIGKSILDSFVENGCEHIWAIVRVASPEFTQHINMLMNNYNVVINPIYVDYSDINQVKEAGKKIQSEKIKIDILVNNIGVSYTTLFQMMNINRMQDVFQINYFSQMIFTQYIIKIMVKFGCGSIINISSTSAIDSDPGLSVYAASKAALLCSTKCIAKEHGKHGIRANCIAPGMTETDMVKNTASEILIKETIEKTVLGGLGKPDDVANTALFLASDLSSYITGQVIRVDGCLSKYI